MEWNFCFPFLATLGRIFIIKDRKEISFCRWKRDIFKIFMTENSLSNEFCCLNSIFLNKINALHKIDINNILYLTIYFSQYWYQCSWKRWTWNRKWLNFCYSYFPPILFHVLSEDCKRRIMWKPHFLYVERNNENHPIIIEWKTSFPITN